MSVNRQATGQGTRETSGFGAAAAASSAGPRSYQNGGHDAQYNALCSTLEKDIRRLTQLAATLKKQVRWMSLHQRGTAW